MTSITFKQLLLRARSSGRAPDACWYTLLLVRYVRRHTTAQWAPPPDCTSPWCSIMFPQAPMTSRLADIAVFTCFPAPAACSRWHIQLTHVAARTQTSPQLRTHVISCQTPLIMHVMRITTPRPRSYVNSYYTFRCVIGVAT